jgi:hypothetical protein
VDPFPGVPPGKMDGVLGKLRRAVGHDEKHYRSKHLEGVKARNDERERKHKLSRKPIWEAFAARQYFKRLWIVQEICVPRSLIVYCAGQSQSWEQLITDRRGDPDMFDGFNNSHSLQILFELDDSRQNYQKGIFPSRGIFELGQQYGSKGCEKIQDRIFALLTLEKRLPNDEEMPGDYSKDICDTAMHILKYRHRHVRDFGTLDLDDKQEVAILRRLKVMADDKRQPTFWKTLYHERTRYENRAICEKPWDERANLLPIYEADGPPRPSRKDGITAQDRLMVEARQAAARTRKRPGQRE